jgi:hypothetical protein
MVERPAWANATARLDAVMVLPSSGAALVTRSVRTGLSTEANSMLLRSVRYDSATAERGYRSVASW